MLPVFRFVRAIIRLPFNLIYRVRSSGGDRLPQGPGVVVCNHIHALDPVTVGCNMRRVFFTMAKAELFKNPLLGFFMRAFGAFPVNRGSGDVGAITTAERLLEEGELLLIFPEGTRSKTGDTGRMKPGALLIALKAGAPVIPAFISTSGGRFRPFKKTFIAFGEPVPPESFFEGADLSSLTKSDYRAASDRLRQAVETRRREVRP